jgi:CBS domain containing-hemolysin-like protein
MADVAAQEAAIETEERELIHSIFDFGDTVVREVMVPRPDMVVVDADVDVDEADPHRDQCRASRGCPRTTRRPTTSSARVPQGPRDAQRQRRGQRAVRHVLRPANFVPESKRIAELLREMQTEKFHMAIVIDEHGGTAGSSRWKTCSRRSSCYLIIPEGHSPV